MQKEKIEQNSFMKTSYRYAKTHHHWCSGVHQNFQFFQYQTTSPQPANSSGTDHFPVCFSALTIQRLTWLIQSHLAVSFVFLSFGEFCDGFNVPTLLAALVIQILIKVLQSECAANHWQPNSIGSHKACLNKTFNQFNSISYSESCYYLRSYWT